MAYLLRRTAQSALVLVLAFTVAYLLLAALPGDAVLARYGNPDLGLTPQQLDDIRQAYGADRPLLERFVEQAGGFLHGDLGYSVSSGASVTELIASNLPPTLILASLGLLVAVVVAVTIAVLATHSRGTWLRRVFRSLPPLFVSLPVFWIGIVLIQVFSFRLGLIPLIGADPFEALVLPVITLAIPIAAPLAQVLIRSIDEVRESPFVAVSRSRGAGSVWLLRRVIGRNAILPTLTMAGLLFGELVGGAVVTEAVFGRPGLGSLTAAAVSTRDTPVLLAIVVISTVGFVLVNLVVDIFYPLLDARLRRSNAVRDVRSAPTPEEAAV